MKLSSLLVGAVVGLLVGVGLSLSLGGQKFGSGTTSSTFGNITAQSITVTTSTISNVSSTSLTLGSGTPIVGSHSDVVSVSPASIAAYDVTTTNIALAGAVSGNTVLLTIPELWSTSTVMFHVTGFGGVATITYVNTSSSAAALTAGQSVRVTTLEY